MVTPFPHVHGAIRASGEIIREVWVRRHAPDVVEASLQNYVRRLTRGSQLQTRRAYDHDSWEGSRKWLFEAIEKGINLEIKKRAESYGRQVKID